MFELESAGRRETKAVLRVRRVQIFVLFRTSDWVPPPIREGSLLYSGSDVNLIQKHPYMHAQKNV